TAEYPSASLPPRTESPSTTPPRFPPPFRSPVFPLGAFGPRSAPRSKNRTSISPARRSSPSALLPCSPSRATPSAKRASPYDDLESHRAAAARPISGQLRPVQARARRANG